ncbi:MAG: hypothetical protein ACO1QS_07435 [Verrucomicrobiota bacterium]
MDEIRQPVLGREQSDPPKNSPFAAKRRRWLHWGVRIAYGLVIAIFLVLLMVFPMPQIGVARLVDEQGNPVAGAWVKLDGLRPKSKHGHWGWNEQVHGYPGPYESNSDGLVTFRYPAYVMEQLETCELSFTVGHSNYVSDRIAAYVVNSSPPSSAGLSARLNHLKDSLVAQVVGKTPGRDIVMKRGAILEITGRFRGEDVPAVELIPMLDGYGYRKEDWHVSGDILRCAKIEPGDLGFYLVHLPDDGPARFSAPVKVMTIAGRTNSFTLELKPGMKIVGQVSGVVKPVKNGRVNAFSHINGIRWWTWTEMDSEGSFTFESLPVGALELAGICDGHVSSRGVHPNWSTSAWLTQLYDNADKSRSVVLTMEKAASCRVQVVGPDDEPVKSAKVMFFPGIQCSKGGMIFPGIPWRAEVGLKKPYSSLRNYQRAASVFAANTDENGYALIENLPGEIQALQVEVENLELPLNSMNTKSRSLDVHLRSGQITEIKVKLQKKGTEVIVD